MRSKVGPDHKAPPAAVTPNVKFPASPPQAATKEVVLNENVRDLYSGNAQSTGAEQSSVQNNAITFPGKKNVERSLGPVGTRHYQDIMTFLKGNGADLYQLKKNLDVALPESNPVPSIGDDLGYERLAFTSRLLDQSPMPLNRVANESGRSRVKLAEKPFSDAFPQLTEEVAYKLALFKADQISFVELAKNLRPVYEKISGDIAAFSNDSAASYFKDTEKKKLEAKGLAGMNWDKVTLALVNTFASEKVPGLAPKEIYQEPSSASKAMLDLNFHRAAFFFESSKSFTEDYTDSSFKNFQTMLDAEAQQGLE